MTGLRHFVLLNRRASLIMLASAIFLASPASVRADELQDLLLRTGSQVSKFLKQFSEVKCTEQVTQERLGKNSSIEYKEDSTYDYLVMLTNAGGELSLDESRLLLREPKRDKKKKNVPLLVSNGFATLFLVFHPFYSGSFEFRALQEEMIDGKRVSKISFQHIRGTRTPAALALRGRDFPLELFGTAWIDPHTAMIVRIVAGVNSTLEDVGLKILRAEIDFAPVSFRGVEPQYWFPIQAQVEVETARQHWRNTHRFTDYKRFAVSTEERVAETK